MGVPKFYRWISERYPCLSEVIKEYQIPEFDNLYLDMNGIIHVCSHPNDDDPHFRISEEKIFADICHYLDFLLKMIKPQKVYFMAIDGVAPRAKMNQQRGRRFRTAKAAEMMEQKARANGEILPTEARFDSNCITPGTPFMARLHEILKSFVTHKISTDPLWQNLRVYLSGHETPGEGEHKIMDFIRYEKSKDNYDANTRHCLYGLDADLIMLGLSSHEPHFSLLREEVRYGKKENQKRIVTPEETTFHLLHISLLREYLGHEFRPAREKLSFEFNLEKVIDDFVLMSFLVGNDFIPHLPQLHIHHNALPILFKTYTDVLPSLGGYINECGNLNLKRFELFFKKLSEFDYEKFGELSDFPPPGSKSKNGDCSSKFDCFDHLLDLGFSKTSVSKTTEYDSSSEDEEGLFELEFNQHKRDYYRSKLAYDNVTDGVLREQAEGYVRAIQWNLNYYYNGIASWSWYYPHHYAPYISDIRNFKEMELIYDMGEPFAPFQQLLSVLPAQSKSLLPVPYQDLMCNPNSALKDYYPEEFETDLNGKQQDWEAVVLIPFINEKLLLKCVHEVDDKLTAEEKQRNQHGPHLLYTHTKKSGGPCDSFLPGYFPPLRSNHAKCQPLDKDIFRVTLENLKKGLCSGVKLDVHFPGFPTLKHIRHTARLSNEEVKVFQMTSQRDNMMLTITEPVESDTEKAANNLLGKIIHVGWPHLHEGYVMNVSSEDEIYAWEKSKVVKKQANTNLWVAQAKSVNEHHHKRLGIFIGEPDNLILVHAKSFMGSQLICNADGKVIENKQWTQITNIYPLQATVTDIDVHCPKIKTAKTHEDIFPLGAVVFLLSQPHYGCMATVINNDLKSNRGCIFVDIEVPREPDFERIIQNQDNLVSQKYRPGYELAKSLGISSYFLSRITGTFLVQTNSKESISPNTVNVGLNLKFNRKNEEVAGFSKKSEHNEWLYSEQVLQTLNCYLSEFPEFFERLIQYAKQDVVYLEDIYPDGGGSEAIAKVTKWLKSQQCASAERQTCGQNTLDVGIISAINNLVKDTVLIPSKNNKMCIKSKSLYSPFHCKGCIIPDPDTKYEIFDRVINVRHNLAVPLGLRGTIIGIRTAEKFCDYILDVLFDKEFFGGLTLHSFCSKVYRLSPSALINLSHGERGLEISSSPRKTLLPTPDKLEKNAWSKGKTETSKQDNRKKGTSRDSAQFNGNNNAASSPIQILKKHTPQQQHSPNLPFYKTEGMALSQKMNSPSAYPSSVAALFNSPQQQQQFVVPKAMPQASNRNSFGTPKSASNTSTSNFLNIWNDLTKKTTPDSDSQPEEVSLQQQSLGKSVTVQELFSAVNNHSKLKEQQGNKEHPPPAQVQRSVPPPKHAAVNELMNMSTALLGSPPTYTYQELGVTGMYISSVRLPDGRTCASEQCVSQPEAAESAAAKAIVILRQSLQMNKFPDNTVPMPRNTPSYPPAMFQNLRLMTPQAMAFPPPPLPFSAVPNVHYPPPGVPPSFVKQNEMYFAGQLPISQFMPPVNVGPRISAPIHNFNYTVPEDKPSSSRQFVPLQVLRQRSRKASEEESAASLSVNDWPNLPTTSPPKPVTQQSTNDASGTVSSMDTTSPANRTASGFTSTTQILSTTPKPRKPRLAAVFTNMD